MVPVWIMHLFSLDSTQRAHGVSEGVPLYVSRESPIARPQM